MDRHETNSFIEKELMGLWPDWTPTEAESRVWFGELSRFDYDVAQIAAQQYFSDTGGNFRRPKPLGIIEKARVILQTRNVGRKYTKDPILTNVYIECIEAPERNPKLEGKRKAVYAATDDLQCDKEHVLRCAETMRKAFERLYGGKWIIVQTKPTEDSGLRGEQAKQKAFRDILSGPDTKTKRWLQKYLDKDNKPMPKRHKEQEQEPVLIGAVVEDEIPF